METQVIVRKSSSPWASPIVLVKKKNGKTRCCIDYRRLNVVNRQDAFPLPRVQDCLDTVRGSIYFSTFDLTLGYHQVLHRINDKKKYTHLRRHMVFKLNKLFKKVKIACFIVLTSLQINVDRGPRKCVPSFEGVLSAFGILADG